MSDVNSGESVTSETDNFVVVNSDAPVAPVEESKQVEESDAKDSEGTSEQDSTDESGAEEEGTTSEDTTGEEEKGEQQEADKPKSRTQKRIDKITRQREDERRKNEQLQRQVDELTKGDSKNEGAPKESDFDTYDEYLTELDKYDGENDGKAGAKSEKPSESEDQSTLTDSQLTAQAILREKIGDGIDKYENFEEVALSEDVAITADMVEALAECDDPLKVMMHLGNNKDVAAGIAGKTPIQQAREIAKLDLTVKVTPPKPTKTTTAADPISPVHGSDSQQKAISDMSFSEYEEHQNKIEQDRRSHG